MFGFLIGTVCLIGLIKVARHGRGGCGGGGGYGYGYGRSCGSQDGEGGGPFGHRHGHGGWGRRGGFGPTIFLRGAFERLETTPGQEKVIVQALDELKETFKKARDDFRGTRSDFASVIRGDALDEASLADVFMKHDTTLSETRRAAVESLHKIHDTLTEKQRQEVADFIEKGPRFGGGGGRWGGGRGRWGGGPYRGEWV